METFWEYVAVLAVFLFCFLMWCFIVRGSNYDMNMNVHEYDSACVPVFSVFIHEMMLVCRNLGPFLGTVHLVSLSHILLPLYSWSSLRFPASLKHSE